MTFVLTLDDIIDIVIALFCLVLFLLYAIAVWRDNKKKKREAKRNDKDGGVDNDT